MAKRRDKIPNIAVLEERFAFVDNETLRKNLAINLQYIIFLIDQEESTELPGPVSYSLFKNLILYTASIVEGIVTYTFKYGIDLGAIDQSRVMKRDTRYRNMREIHKISEVKHVVSGIREKGYEKFNFRRTSFNDVIKAARKARIIDKSLAERIDDLREKRNKIHLASLEIVDDYYDKQEVNDAFALTAEVIDASERYLRSIDEN